MIITIDEIVSFGLQKKQALYRLNSLCSNKVIYRVDGSSFEIQYSQLQDIFRGFPEALELAKQKFSAENNKSSLSITPMGMSLNSEAIGNTNELLGELEESRRQLDKYKLEAITLRDQLDNEQLLVNRYERTASLALRKYSPITLTTRKVTNNGYHVILQLSDLHIGCKYNNQFSSYCIQDSIDYMEIYLSKVINELDQIKNNIASILIILGGDIADGEGIYKGQVFHQEVGAIEQAVISAEILKKVIITLSEYGNVSMKCVKGNHGRTGTYKHPNNPKSNFDLLTYYILKYSFNDLPTVIGVGPILVSDHYGINVAITHGDRLRVSFPSVHKRAFQVDQLTRNSGKKNIPLFTHHTHSPLQCQTANVPIFCNGSLLGLSEFAIENAFVPQPRIQNMILSSIKDSTFNLEHYIPLQLGPAAVFSEFSEISDPLKEIFGEDYRNIDEE